MPPQTLHWYINGHSDPPHTRRGVSDACKSGGILVGRGGSPAVNPANASAEQASYSFCSDVVDESETGRMNEHAQTTGSTSWCCIYPLTPQKNGCSRACCLSWSHFWWSLPWALYILIRCDKHGWVDQLIEIWIMIAFCVIIFTVLCVDQESYWYSIAWTSWNNPVPQKKERSSIASHAGTNWWLELRASQINGRLERPPGANHVKEDLLIVIVRLHRSVA